MIIRWNQTWVFRTIAIAHGGEENNNINNNNSRSGRRKKPQELPMNFFLLQCVIDNLPIFSSFFIQCCLRFSLSLSWLGWNFYRRSLLTDRFSKGFNVTTLIDILWKTHTHIYAYICVYVTCKKKIEEKKCRFICIEVVRIVIEQQ